MKKTLSSLLWIGTLTMPLGLLSLAWALFVVLFRPKIRISRLAKICVEIEVCALMQMEAMGAGSLVYRQFYEEHFLCLLMGVMQVDEVAALLYVNHSWTLVDSVTMPVHGSAIELIYDFGAQILADIVWKFCSIEPDAGLAKGQVI